MLEETARHVDAWLRENPVRPDVQAIKDEVQMAKNELDDNKAADVAFIDRELELRNQRIADLEAECERLRRVNDEDRDEYERQLGEANVYVAQSINELKRAHETECWRWQQELAEARRGTAP